MATALILLGSTQLQKRIPTQIWPRATTLVLTVFGTFVSWAADLPSRGVAVVGELPAGLPSLAIPTITPSRLTELLPSVAMLVLVGFVESIAVAKTIAAKVGYEIDPDRELIGLGLSNVASALSGGFPSFGSLSRTPVNYITGARTRFAGVVTAALVLLVVLLFTPLLRYMPKPVMAAIIIVAVSKMADFAEFFHIWQQRKAEVALWLMPFLGTLIIGIDAGLLGSLVVCVLLVINHASLAHATLQVDQLRDRTPSTHTAPPQAPSKPHASPPPRPLHTLRTPCYRLLLRTSSTRTTTSRGTSSPHSSRRPCRSSRTSESARCAPLRSRRCTPAEPKVPCLAAAHARCRGLPACSGPFPGLERSISRCFGAE